MYMQRIRILLVVIAAGLVLVAARLVHLQAVKGPEYVERAARRMQTVELRQARRGRILDRFGGLDGAAILAYDKPCWDLSLDYWLCVLTVGNTAGFHEFGFGVPERSFVRATIDEDTLLIEHQVFEQVFEVVENGRKPRVAMTHVGQFMADRMKFTIETSRNIRPLSRERLAQKRDIGTPTTPLINWGIMIETLRYSVHPAVI